MLDRIYMRLLTILIGKRTVVANAAIYGAIVSKSEGAIFVGNMVNSA